MAEEAENNSGAGGDAGASKGSGGAGGGETGQGGEKKTGLGGIIDASGAGKETGTDDKFQGAPKFGDFDSALIPEHLRGATAEETLSKLYPAYKGMRDESAKAGKAPEKPEDYEPLKLSDESSKIYGDLKDDPVIQAAAKHAHAAGLPQDKFQQVMGGIMDDLVKSGLVEPTINPNDEWAKLQKEDPNATQTVQKMSAFLENAKTVDKVPQDVLDELETMTSTASGIKALSYMQGKMGEQTTQMNNTGEGGGAVTKESIREMMKDPRYNTRDPKYDKDFRARADKLNREINS